MKSSLLILMIFLLGMLAGAFRLIPGNHHPDGITGIILYAMLFFVGVSVGADKHIWNQLKEIKPVVFVLPLTTVAGTTLGLAIYYLLFSYPSGADLFAVGSGYGYYSLSSIVIGKISGETMGLISLLANMIREIMTLVFAPVMVKYFGKLAPIASGGATTSDTTLPMIVKYSGKEYVLGSIIHGIVLTLLVPLIITFIYSL